MAQTSDKTFKLGVVEGFFGIPWSWDARISYADFISLSGFNTYLYAPKSDRLLRQDWHLPFPKEQLGKLKELALVYQRKNLNFGIGLSPFELYRNFNSEKKDLLKAKLDQINAINPSILCILFDDMQGDLNAMATQQVEITNFIIQHSQASHFIFCPTYYSDDPLLVTHFGSQPEHYLEDIGSSLDPAIDIFWTGPKVFSGTYPAQHLQEVTEKLKRKPLIWDNYPVNDAKRLTDFLHLEPFPNQASVMREFTSGHLANPMNQAFLSQLPLFSLSQYYQGNSATNLLQKACEALCPAALTTFILDDAPLFQQQGLAAMNEHDKQVYLDKYLSYAEHPIAKEIIEWLQGVYTFDPNCLT
ncbi:MAG: beta-N-acetylglucosaminidase domain-containing protein [Gammaproteobacteria bacterium]|jgi:hyaluronoglucosaminidase|nr:beta-N-acetylglucosaminidase domain-containing protein [Gammaproteobacteria bacterium]